MLVKVHIHPTHRQFANGLEVANVEGSTVGECLNHLVKQYPGMEKALFDKKEKLLNIIDVYLNHASTHPNELIKPMEDGDEIHLVVMLTGG